MVREQIPERASQKLGGVSGLSLHLIGGGAGLPDCMVITSCNEHTGIVSSVWIMIDLIHLCDLLARWLCFFYMLLFLGKEGQRGQEQDGGKVRTTA